jgi:hypothetical protein
MRKSQAFIVRVAATQFGVLPESFSLDEIKFSYSQQKMEEYLKYHEESLMQILDNDDEVI